MSVVKHHRWRNQYGDLVIRATKTRFKTGIWTLKKLVQRLNVTFGTQISFDWCISEFSSVSPSECQDKPASLPILLIHYLTSSHPTKSASLLLRPRPVLFRIHILYAPVPFVEYYMIVLGISVCATLPVNCTGTKVVLFIVLLNYWYTPTVTAVTLWRIVVFACILHITVYANCSDLLLVDRSVVMACLRDLMFPQRCAVEDSGLLRRRAVSLAKCFPHFRRHVTHYSSVLQ
jgi:hypothetical protein